MQGIELWYYTKIIFLMGWYLVRNIYRSQLT